MQNKYKADWRSKRRVVYKCGKWVHTWEIATELTTTLFSSWPRKRAELISANAKKVQ